MNIIAKGGEDLQGRTGGELLMMFLGKSVNTGLIDLYSVLITTKDSITLPVDNLSNGMYDYTTGRTSDGAICSTVRTDEQDFSGEFNMSLQEDFIYVNDNASIVQNKLTALLKGDTIDLGADKIIPVGTNGTFKTFTTLAKKNEMNRDFKYLFFNEGDKIKVAGGADPETGDFVLKNNPYKNKFNKTYKTMAIDIRNLSESGKQISKFIPIVACKNVEWAEGDINNLNLTLDRCGEIWERRDYFVEIDKSEAFPETATTIREARVDYIIVDNSSGATVGDDEYALEIDSTNGTYSLVKGSTSVDISAKVKEGTRFKTTKLVEDGNVTEVNTFAVLKSATNLANFSLKDGVARYYTTVKNFNRDTENFEDYVSIDY